MMPAQKKLLICDLVSFGAGNTSRRSWRRRGVLEHVSSSYIRPLSKRPSNLTPDHSNTNNIPISDLESLHGPNCSRIIKQITLACQQYGFFQVKNHGIPKSQISNMLGITKEFFELPKSERLKIYSDDPLKTTRLSTSFNVCTEKVSNWRDLLRLHCYPLQDYLHEWPTNPPSFRSYLIFHKNEGRVGPHLL